MIFYFSGTGNSTYMAKRIAEQTGDTLCCINDCLKEKKLYKGETPETMVFVAPTYSWQLPKVVEQWIRRSPFIGAVGLGQPKAYFVLTCGGSMGNAGKYAEALCKEKGFAFMGCAQIVMPENYIALFDAPDEDEAKKIIDRAEPEADELIARIQNGEEFPKKPVSLGDKLLSGPVNALFYPLFVHAKSFYAENTCIGCGKCEKVCPLNNVRIQDGKPVWGSSCTHCMACIASCPAEAIEYGKKSAGKPRYRCPYEKK